jgi:prepilin-type N-terminal cleavage/methylation domain-containing protein
MKQVSKKKGFSLIELIVVIAVIAAIAAVIVPQFSNISGAAKNSTDKRNAQMWNEVYSNAYALDGDNTYGSGVSTITASITSVPEIAKNINVSGTYMNFYAPSFSFVGDKKSNYGFTAGKGFTYTN